MKTEKLFSFSPLLIVSLLALRIAAFIIDYFSLFPGDLVFIALYLLFYLLIGIFVFSKIKDKKKALISTAILEIGISVMVLAIYGIMCIIPTTKISMVHFWTSFLFHLGFLNPLNFLLYSKLGQTISCFIICTLLSPVSVMFIYLFDMIYSIIKRGKQS